MKRIIALLVALVFVLSAFAACTQKTGDTDETTTPGETTEPGTTTPDDPSFVPAITADTWISAGSVKVKGEDVRPKNAVINTTLYMAKNEKEAFNISIRSGSAYEGLKIVVVSGNNNQIAVEYFDLHLVAAGNNTYPDGMVPYNGSFNVEANVTKTIMVRFTTTSSTKSGTYVYKFELQTADGKTVQRFTADVTVWNFALPDTLTSVGTVNIDKPSIQYGEGIPGAQITTYYREYYEFLLEYGLAGQTIPYDILNSKADEYLDDPRIKAFVVPWDITDEKLTQYYEKLSQKQEWLDKAYFYIYEEPVNVAHLQIIKERCERLQRLCPQIKICVTFFRNVRVDQTTDSIDTLAKYVDIWSPKTACWTNGWMADPVKNGYFGDRMDAEVRKGDNVWWYVSWEPGNPYCNLFVNEDGINHVELFWQQYLYNTEGMMYWCANYWSETDNPWTDIATVKSVWLNCYGDGSLLYPGSHVNVKGPIASFRLECIRSGMEDYDLLLKAENLFGRPWVLEQVNKITSSMTVHTDDVALYTSVRAAIGNAIVAELNH